MMYVSFSLRLARCGPNGYSESKTKAFSIYVCMFNILMTSHFRLLVAVRSTLVVKCVSCLFVRLFFFVCNFFFYIGMEY